MKKLFTLIAFLTCFLGASAVTIIDAEVDFSKMTDISEMQWKSWGGQGREKFDIQDGCLHFSQDARTDDDWGVQVFPIGDVAAEAGTTYIFELKIKGTGYQTNKEGENIGSAVHNVNFQVGSANHDKYSAIQVTEDFEVVQIEYECTADGTGHILFQCGSWVGDLWIEYMKIYHEGKEEKPVEWVNILANGDASAAWDNPDAQSIGNEFVGEGAELVSAYSKEFGVNENNPHAAYIEDGAFVTHTQKVDPVIVWEEAGSQWGVDHQAGDPKPDNEWQNQFWINFPRALKDGEQVKISFKYKASKEAQAATQDHKNAPGDYLGGGSVGTIKFTTDWQTYEKEYAAAAGAHSLAFNLGVNNQYEDDITFYFDDLSLSIMKLEEGYFVAATDTEDGDPAYDFDNAIKFEDAEDGLLAATVGGESEDTWVNQVMISTARGNDKGFKAATLKISGAVKNDPTDWKAYEEGAKATINLPVRGMWRILLDPGEDQVMSFEKLAGEADLEEIEIKANTTEVVVHGQAKVQNTWDNQFWIVANDVVKNGAETWLEFDYWLESDEVEEAKVTTQFQGEPSNWIANGATDDLTFTTEKQTFKGIVNIKNDGVKSIAFNMAEIDEPANYYITNVIWKLNDNTASLIDQEGTKPFWMVEGNGNPMHQFGVDPEQPKLEGDTNGDGEVNVADIDIVIEAIGEEYNKAADANGDGEVNVADADYIIERIGGTEE